MSRRRPTDVRRDAVSLRAPLAVGFVAAVLTYVGCVQPNSGDLAPSELPSTTLTHAPTPSPTRPPTTTKNGPEVAKSTEASAATLPPPAEADATVPPATETQAATAKPPARQPFHDWLAPAAAVVISGEQLGYLEPCGCTQGQLGGLLRRYEFLEKLANDRKWPLVRLDLGSLIRDPASARGGPEQAKIKYIAALEALSVMRYDALALSAEDLEVGVDQAFGQILNLPADGPRVVCANVGVPGFESKLVPSLRVSAGPVKVGVTAVTDPATLEALKDPSIDILEIKAIDQTLPATLADLEKDTQTQVLLAQGPPELARSLAEKYPGFDIVVSTSTHPDPEPQPVALNGGKTLLVNVGQKGKYVGVVGIFPGGDQPHRYERVVLDPTLDGPAEPMRKVVEKQFRDALKQQGIVERFPKHDFVSGAGVVAGATFVGAETCKQCHPNTYDVWAESKHAHAFESLVTDKKPNTMFDAECVTCHTTGFEYTSGWKSAELTPRLKGNQCENCHGPASRHVADPTNAAFRTPMHLTAEQADKNRLCLSCHDEDNSPHFEFAKYWAEIEHSLLDNPRENMKKLGAGAAVKPTP